MLYQIMVLGIFYRLTINYIKQGISHDPFQVIQYMIRMDILQY